MTVKRVLRGGSRNQSTADFSRHTLFVSDNRYFAATAKNVDVADVTMEDGLLVMRDAADLTKVNPITDAGDLAKVIGIAKVNGEVVLAQNAETPINFSYQGEVDGAELVLPGVATLNTLVGDRTLKDVLTGLGIIVLNVTDHSKFDN